MRKKIAYDIIGALTLVVVGGWFALCWAAGMIGNAQTVADFMKSDSVSHTAVIWFSHQPWEVPFFLAFFLIILLVGARISADRALIHDLTLANTEIAQLRTRPKIQLAVNVSADALDIDYHNSDLFSKLHIFPNGSSERSIYVKITNIGDGFISDCVLKLKSLSPLILDGALVVFSSSTPLIPNQYKFVLIATFFETVVFLNGEEEKVTIRQPYGGGFFAGHIKIDAPTREQPLTLIMEAYASECKSCERAFKLWVDRPSRKLNFERA